MNFCQWPPPGQWPFVFHRAILCLHLPASTLLPYLSRVCTYPRPRPHYHYVTALHSHLCLHLRTCISTYTLPSSVPCTISEGRQRRAQYIILCVAHIIEIHNIYYKTPGFSAKKQYLDRHMCIMHRNYGSLKSLKEVSLVSFSNNANYFDFKKVPIPIKGPLGNRPHL